MEGGGVGKERIEGRKCMRRGREWERWERERGRIDRVVEGIGRKRDRERNRELGE